MKKYNLEIIVFVSGAVVMVLELVAARMLAPFLGTSLIVWTSLIAIILGSLSIGYYYGGKLADESANYKTLAIFFLFAAILVFLTILINGPVLSFFAALNWGLRISSVLVTTILFAPASILLGMVSPYALRLKLSDLKSSGTEAGRLYAISTLGSIAGTFLAGFYLIPFFGNFNLMIALAVVLIFLSIFTYGKFLKLNKWHYLIITFSFFILLAVAFISQKIWQLPGLVIDIDSSYSRIMIFDSLDEETGRVKRSWQTDRHATQSSMYLDNPDELVHEYTKYYRLADYFEHKMENTLMIGGAAYSYPKEFLKRFPNANMTVVEIDPMATELAKEYFYLEENDRLDIYHEDARYFLEKTSESYDAIYLDAFLSAIAIPYQLTTQETVEKFYDLLEDDGIVLVNLISAIDGEKGRFLQAEYKTYLSVFPYVYILPVQDNQDGKIVQNLMLVAMKTKLEIKANSNEELAEYWNGRWEKEIDLSQVDILTDDYAPVDCYVLQML